MTYDDEVAADIRKKNRQHIADRVLTLVRDFETLSNAVLKSAFDKKPTMGAVLRQMAPAFIDVVNDARARDVALPAALRPFLQWLRNMALLGVPVEEIKFEQYQKNTKIAMEDTKIAMEDVSAFGDHFQTKMPMHTPTQTASNVFAQRMKPTPTPISTKPKHAPFPPVVRGKRLVTLDDDE